MGRKGEGEGGKQPEPESSPHREVASHPVGMQLWAERKGKEWQPVPLGDNCL